MHMQESVWPLKLYARNSKYTDTDWAVSVVALEDYTYS